MLNAAVPAIPCRIVAAAAMDDLPDSKLDLPSRYHLPVIKTEVYHEKFAQMLLGKSFCPGRHMIS
jgi:hypothetical protein